MSSSRFHEEPKLTPEVSSKISQLLSDDHREWRAGKAQILSHDDAKREIDGLVRSMKQAVAALVI